MSLLASLRFAKDQFTSALLWLVDGLREAVGTRRMVWIAFQTFLGSVGVTAMGYSTILLIRLSIPRAEPLPGLDVPDVPLWVIYLGIFSGGIVGGLMFYRSEKEASLASVDFGAALRTSLVRLLSRPMTRGWQTAVTQAPQRVVLQVGVADVRECTMAAREVIRLIGPITLFLGTVPILFLLEPLTTLVLIPIGIALAIPVLLVSRRVEALSQSFEVTQGSTRDLVSASVADLLDSRPGETDLRGLATARRGDEVLHQRMLQPVRVRAFTTVATSLVVMVILSLLLAQTSEGETVNIFRFIIYLITFRLCTAALRTMGNALVAITRRSIPIERYRALIRDLEAYRAGRIARAQGADLPSVLRLRTPTDNYVEVQKGKTTVVLVPRAPKVSTAEAVLVAFEQAMDDECGAVDLLGIARIRRNGADKDEAEESHYFVSDREEPATDPYQLDVVIQGDVAETAIEATAAFTFVITHIPAGAVNQSLDDWSHLIDGVVVVNDADVVMGGSIDWARKNRRQISESLVRRPVPN